MHDRCRDRLSPWDTDSNLTCPTSMEAVFFKLLQGVHTISTLFSLQPCMLLAFTSCRHGRAGTQALLTFITHNIVSAPLLLALTSCRHLSPQGQVSEALLDVCCTHPRGPLQQL